MNDRRNWHDLALEDIDCWGLDFATDAHATMLEYQATGFHSRPSDEAIAGYGEGIQTYKENH